MHKLWIGPWQEFPAQRIVDTRLAKLPHYLMTKIPVTEFCQNRAHDGRLIWLETLSHDRGTAPYLAVLNNAALIGPVIIQIGRDGKLTSIDVEKGTATLDLSRANPAKGVELLTRECGPMRSGSYLMTWAMRSLNFWHWIMEALPKVIMAEAGGFNGTYIIPPPSAKTQFIEESLEIIGIDPARIIPYDGKPWWLEQLYFPQPINGHFSISLFPRLLAELRKRLTDACQELPIRYDRLYIARGSAALSRKVENEIKLLDTLYRFGFNRITMESLSLREQISTALGATCLITPHGAGMTHCLFMPEKSLVIEMFNGNYVNPCMIPVVDLLQHRYFMMPNTGIGLMDTPDDKICAYTYGIEIILKRELGTHAMEWQGIR
jgi:capsular polysaccharide biosynthesis protein